MATFGVPRRIEWRDHFLTKFGALAEHRIHVLGAHLWITGSPIVVSNVEDLVQKEAHVAQRGFVLRHLKGPIACVRGDDAPAHGHPIMPRQASGRKRQGAARTYVSPSRCPWLNGDGE